MLQPTTDQWCTSPHRAKELAEALATKLGDTVHNRGYGHWCLEAHGHLFVGCVPKTSGAGRPPARLVFLVRLGEHRVLACGDSLAELVEELAGLQLV